MIYGIGIDIVDISRIKSILKGDGDRFLRRIFTPAEIDYFTRLKEPFPQIAGRFAAKEAFYKAAGGYDKFNFRHIETVSKENGQPYLKLYGNAGESIIEKGINNIFLSISHEKDYAIAQVVLEK